MWVEFVITENSITCSLVLGRVDSFAIQVELATRFVETVIMLVTGTFAVSAFGSARSFVMSFSTTDEALVVIFVFRARVVVKRLWWVASDGGVDDVSIVQ